MLTGFPTRESVLRSIATKDLSSHPMRMRILSESAAADESKDLSSHPVPGHRPEPASSYNKLNGSISTSTAVWGISLASQYAMAPLSSFVSTDRFGDFSRN